MFEFCALFRHPFPGLLDSAGAPAKVEAEAITQHLMEASIACVNINTLSRS